MTSVIDDASTYLLGYVYRMVVAGLTKQNADKYMSGFWEVDK